MTFTKCQIEFTLEKGMGKCSECQLLSCFMDNCEVDGCEELAVLRKFRDEYIMSTAEGRALVEKYNKIAPEIVGHINASDKKEIYYKYIREVVDRCVRLIKVNENERALIEYKFLVKNLKKEFKL